jgi:hypothetical protein
MKRLQIVGPRRASSPRAAQQYPRLSGKIGQKLAKKHGVRRAVNVDDGDQLTAIFKRSEFL